MSEKTVEYCLYQGYVETIEPWYTGTKVLLLAQGGELLVDKPARDGKRFWLFTLPKALVERKEPPPFSIGLLSTFEVLADHG